MSSETEDREDWPLEQGDLKKGHLDGRDLPLEQRPVAGDAPAAERAAEPQAQGQ